MSNWLTFAAASVLAVALAGCDNGGGSNNGGGAPPVVTPPPATGVAVPPGTPVDASTFTAAQFAAMTPVVPEVAVTINSAPVVSFSVTNGAGGPPIKGLTASTTGSNGVTQLNNLRFALAKLMPETSAVISGRTVTTPSRWVSYIVTTNATAAAPATASRPTTERNGTLVDNGNGTYTYTFARDVTTVKADVAAMTLTPPNNAADLDDLTFVRTAVHRLSLEISGSGGTGTTPAAIVNPANAIFDFVPSRSADATHGAVTAADPSRNIVPTQKCNDCHQSLGGFPGASAANVDAEFHGGNRNKIEYCIVCHTDQRKFGRVEATVVAGVNGNYDGTPDPADPGSILGNGTYRINGLAVGALSTHIHKIHMSANLTKVGYNYGDIAYEEACKFPQDVRNCTKCHDANATTTPDATARTPQGDNWKNVPNRAACGACHDGINFLTGGGVRLEDKAADVAAGNPVGTTQSGHAGGIQRNDEACGFCHAPSDIDLVFHTPVTPPNPTNSLIAGQTNNNTNAASIASNKDRLPTGAIKISYEISSVAVNTSGNPVMKFRILQNGARADLNVFSTDTVANPIATQEIYTNFMGAPSVYFVYAVPQDSFATPADFNASASSYLRSLWNGTATGVGAGTLSATPDADGFYTATITGSTIPANAQMLTGGLGYSYNVRSSLPLTQTNLTAFPTAAATAVGLTPTMPNRTGGLIVIAPNAQKAKDGTTGRRAIVSDALCNKCHLELGTFTEEAFHAGQRNDGTTCAWCHTPNRSSSGWSADSEYFVHAIHGRAKRNPSNPFVANPEFDFTWHAATPTDGFYTIGYPGVLKNCETCHLPGTFDFTAPASAAALPNRLYRTAVTNTLASASATAFQFAPAIMNGRSWAPRDTAFGAAFAVDNNGAPVPPPAPPAVGNTANLVISPIATVCSSCHTSGVAMQHIEAEGGSLYQPRGTPATATAPATLALAKQELCMLCHGPDSAFGVGIAAVHSRP